MPRNWPFGRSRGLWYPLRVRASGRMSVEQRRVVELARRLDVAVYKLDPVTWRFIGANGVDLTTRSPGLLTRSDFDPADRAAA